MPIFLHIPIFTRPRSRSSVYTASEQYHFMNYLCLWWVWYFRIFFGVLQVSRFWMISERAKRSPMSPRIFISSPLQGRRLMSGRSQKYAARVAPQQDAQDMIVPMIPPMMPLPVLVSITDFFQNLLLLYQKATRKSGKNKIVIPERAISMPVWTFP